MPEQFTAEWYKATLAAIFNLFAKAHRAPAADAGAQMLYMMREQGRSLADVEQWLINPQADDAALRRSAPPRDEPAGGGDMIPIRDITFLDVDIRDWPATTRITRLELRRNGVHVEFDKADGPQRWPDFTLPGWTGPLQYSLGMALHVRGRWYAAAPIEFWHGCDVNGGPIQNQNVDGSGKGQVAKNWFYDGPWMANDGELRSIARSTIVGYQPKPGEEIGIYVCAGDGRNKVVSVKERSNIVKIAMPADGATATFTWP